MRPIEKRIAAIEATHVSREASDTALFICPADVDRNAFAAECAIKTGDQESIIIVLVSPRTGGPEVIH